MATTFPPGRHELGGVYIGCVYICHKIDVLQLVIERHDWIESVVKSYQRLVQMSVRLIKAKRVRHSDPRDDRIVGSPGRCES